MSVQAILCFRPDRSNELQINSRCKKTFFDRVTYFFRKLYTLITYIIQLNIPMILRLRTIMCSLKTSKHNNELQMGKETVAHCLKHIEFPEFVGINFDILEYCVPSIMLGILDSGNAFFNVPLDRATYKEIYTSLHVKYIFAKYITSDREVICQFHIHGQSIYLTKLTEIQENPETQEKSKNSPKWYHFAYAIATSGSTGAPKVVQVPHPCILPNIMDLKKILDVKNSDKVSQLTNFTFDPSIVEIFLGLTSAATLFMVSKILKNEADRLLTKIVLSRVTILQITPSLLFYKWSMECLKRTILNKDSALRILLLGGEPFPNIKLLSEACHPQNMTRCFNIYGITEVSCWSSLNEVIKNNDTDESCLGEPLSETIFQIRNEDNKIVTKGEGILYIGSSSRICTIGNEIEENLKKPVFRNTGDVVSIDNHGKIFYRGRNNNIIKRFGNKVNLRELERITTELNFVRNCVALWDAESHKLYLCLSTTTNKEFSYVKSDVLSHLRILPAIYKPDKIIILRHFDFTTSGKICLVSLRKLCKETAETDMNNANDLHCNVSEIFGDIWNRHIKTKDVGFVISGGTSIAALQISNATSAAFKMEFPELISMLLKDTMFIECVNYIKSTLNKDVQIRKDVICSTDVPVNDDLPRKTFNAERSITKTSSNNFSISINKRNSSHWYKCRGRIYGDAVIEERDTTLLSNISNIKILANYNLQKCVDASPTVFSYSKAELFVTVGSHSGIICTVDLLESDNKSFEVKLPDRIEASVLITADFCGVVGCYDGYIYCIHLKTGETIWKYQTQGMVKCTAITCMQGTKIFVGSYDHHVYCLSIENGAQIWKSKASQGGICATGCLHLQSASVLFGTLDGSCVALQQSSGQITWKRKLSNPIFVAPVVLQTGHALFCSVTGALFCFDIETNCQMWQYEIYGNVFSYPVIRTQDSTDNEHIILASHNKNLYCLEISRSITEKTELKLKYTLQLHSPIFATSWCENEYMFVACTDGSFQVYDLLKGKLLASNILPGEIFSSPVVHNDLVVLGCRDDNLYVLKLS